MFKKKPNIKPLSPLRSSDRRRTADQIIADFKLEPGQSHGESQDEVSGRGSTAVSALRNSLLPESSMSARFTTTVGPDLKQVYGTVYVASLPGQEQRILWMKLEERLYPTVYTLWHNPHLCPLLHTPALVLQKLRGGADLMTPGLARGPPFPANAIKNAIVAIATLENPSVPMAVGVCDIDVSALKAVQGEKGRAVRSMHWDGDELWAWNTGGKPGGTAPEHIDGWLEDITDLGRSVRQVDLDEDVEDSQEDGGVVLDPNVGHGCEEARNTFVEGEGAPAFDEAPPDEQEFSTREIDEAFRKAFLYSIHHHINNYKNESNYGLDFPIPQSLVMSNLIQPFLPVFTPAQTLSFQMKKTSWKNIKKFIKNLDKERLLKSKDRNGGETVILDIDFEDRVFQDFVPYRLPKKEVPPSGAGVGGEVGAENTGRAVGDESIGQHLKKINLFRPKEKLAPLFAAANCNELRPIVTTYIETENLVSSTNKRLVNLNPILANAVFDGQSSMDREVLAKGNAPRDTIIDRVIQGCSPFWAILRNDETKDNVKPKAGTSPKVQILLETRSGNKTVSKVSGVEVFYINPQTLAEELQKACASSTSVNQLVGSSPKNPVMEIMVQGPQKEEISKALEKRGVSRQWIEIVDKTKGKKR
ncbi:MAG: hypothetical protein M1827_002173 [Pycnora praestabilis]|nr:MAG: hypothetical protein M1827_002173 [Pycnora praestabilis]